MSVQDVDAIAKTSCEEEECVWHHVGGKHKRGQGKLDSSHKRNFKRRRHHHDHREGSEEEKSECEDSRFIDAVVTLFISLPTIALSFPCLMCVP
jgi:hypothetical protein